MLDVEGTEAAVGKVGMMLSSSLVDIESVEVGESGAVSLSSSSTADLEMLRDVTGRLSSEVQLACT